MASQTALQVLRDFVDAFDSVQKQLGDGSVQPVVSLTQISSLGVEGVSILKKHLENSTNSVFSVTVDADANSVSLMPTGPMPPKQKLTKKTLATAGQVKGASDKVPRPPNAFIIYRKDWHSTIVAQNPGVHNNAISVIIGDKWRGESEEVRDVYKQKAADAKALHELNHPEYQYQPRKPSEKKRRMTKNKLAKIAKAQAEGNGEAVMQQPLPYDFDPAALVHENLYNHSAAHSMQLNNYGTEYALQQPSIQQNIDDNSATFDVGPNLESRLFTTLQEFNTNTPESYVIHPVPPALQAMPIAVQIASQVAAGTYVKIPEYTNAVVAQPTVNGQLANTVTRFPYSAGPEAEAIMQQPWARELESVRKQAAITSHPRQQLSQDTAVNSTEIDRQDVLDLDFDSFIDMNAFNGIPSPDHIGPPGIDIDFNSFGDGYEVDFGNNDMSA
ncbi:hypothetical protein LTR17_010869 [Elasticomyces elasticus]|nr:hypothetical protein LTR17_010869 [Elasticomyces elasticus]